MKEGGFTMRWSDFLTSVYVDLPLAATSRWLTGNGKPLSDAGWATYDSAVVLANEAMNQFYSNRVVADIFGDALEAAFLTQYLLEGSAAKALLGGSNFNNDADQIDFRTKENEAAGEVRAASFATSAAAYRRAAGSRRKAAA